MMINKFNTMIQTIRDFFKSKALKKVEALEVRVKALEDANKLRVANGNFRRNKNKNRTQDTTTA